MIGLELLKTGFSVAHSWSTFRKRYSTADPRTHLVPLKSRLDSAGAGSVGLQQNGLEKALKSGSTSCCETLIIYTSVVTIRYSVSSRCVTL